jgi:A/G-specific adenine glycosylase
MPAGPIARKLMAWYRRHRRDLPWRENQDPYRVWVSEIMLQQTQVERVKEFFSRFMRRFPTVSALARAPERDVLKHWEGLGYYRRARQLQAAAKQIVQHHEGEFPRSVAALRKLPGIGRYTAGAIASIAFGLPEPIIEANTRRVIARLAGHTAPVGGAEDEPLWQLAAELVPSRDPGSFNQALMELGALVCTPERPACSRCPLATACVAHRDNLTATIPAMPPRRAAQEIRETALVVRHGGRVLVERRAAGEWWEGLWDFPRAKPGEARAKGDRRLAEVRYSVTHHRVTCRVVERHASRPPATGPTRRFVTLTRLAKLAMTAPGRRIALLLHAARAIHGPASLAGPPPGT